MSGPLFGIVPAGQPLVTEPSSVLSETSFIYNLPTARPFSHISVFLVPGISLPPDTAAAIYHASAAEVAAATASKQTPNFRFLGGIGQGKESAIFKVKATAADAGQVIGISIEPAATVASRLDELASNKSTLGTGKLDPPTTLVLAQRIINNAFNFLASFSGTAGPGGIEVVPLKAFEEWWRKFESRVRSDPSFLEKQDES